MRGRLRAGGRDPSRIRRRRQVVPFRLAVDADGSRQDGESYGEGSPFPCRRKTGARHVWKTPCGGPGGRVREFEGALMIVTTTPTVEGYPVTAYLRVVCGETIAGVNAFKDMAAGLRNIVGGRSESYEQELIQARESALAEMVQRAQELGAEGVVGVDIDYETLGQNNGMLMVTAAGTAVRFSSNQQGNVGY